MIRIIRLYTVCRGGGRNGANMDALDSPYQTPELSPNGTHHRPGLWSVDHALNVGEYGPLDSHRTILFAMVSGPERQCHPRADNEYTNWS